MLHKQYGKEWLMGRYYIRYHMVTHFVTILKIAGIGVSSGERVVLKPKAKVPTMFWAGSVWIFGEMVAY